MVPLNSTLLRSYLMCAYVLIWIPSVRLECRSGSVLEAACRDEQVVTRSSYLANDPESDEPVTITCLNPRNGHSHTGWSQSPGGDGGRPLDTSPAKYTVDENRLTINYINGTDEGLYRCVYGNFGAVKNTCIYVYGKAVFASCPLDGSLASCASNPMSLSVDNGGGASFDAIVTHTPGGSCGFRQQITNVKLMKINREFGVSDELLLSCDTSMTTMCSNSRVSLSRGNDPGNEFVFTLTGTNINDSGMYEVVVDVIHPRSGSQGTITKKFHLNVTARSRPVTTIAVETTSTTADQSSSGPTQGSVETSSTDTSVSSKKNNLSIPIVIAAVVAVAIAALVLVSIVGIGYTVKIKRKKRISKKTFSEKVQSHVKTVEYSGPLVEEEIGDTMLQTHLNGTIRAVQNQPDANTKAVTELPPSNTRMSYIEPDSALFNHWDDVDDQAVSNV